MGLCLGAACTLNLWSERLEKKCERRAKHPKTALKLLVYVRSLLRATPSIDTLS